MDPSNAGAIIDSPNTHIYGTFSVLLVARGPPEPYPTTVYCQAPPNLYIHRAFFSAKEKTLRVAATPCQLQKTYQIHRFLRHNQPHCAETSKITSRNHSEPVILLNAITLPKNGTSIRPRGHSPTNKPKHATNPIEHPIPHRPGLLPFPRHFSPRFPCFAPSFLQSAQTLDVLPHCRDFPQDAPVHLPVVQVLPRYVRLPAIDHPPPPG